MQGFQKAHLAKSAFHQGLRGRSPVALEKVLVQRAGVNSNANGHLAFRSGVYHLGHCLLIANIARVDPQAVYARPQCAQGKTVIKVDVSNEGSNRLLFDDL